MRKFETQVIGDCSYTVTQLTAGAGLPVFSRLLSVLAILNADSFASEEAFLAGVANVLRDPKLSEHLEAFCAAFRGSTQVNLNGNMIALDALYDEHFAGKYIELIQWLMFCIKLNFATSFLEAIRKGRDLMQSFPVESGSSKSQSPLKKTG